MSLRNEFISSCCSLSLSGAGRECVGHRTGMTLLVQCRALANCKFFAVEMKEEVCA